MGLTITEAFDWFLICDMKNMGVKCMPEEKESTSTCEEFDGANLSSVEFRCGDLRRSYQDQSRNCFVLTGNVDVQCLSTYNTPNSLYQYNVEKSYAVDDHKPLEEWGRYFCDIIGEIENNVKRRNDNAIPLDFADAMILVAALSSLIKLTETDLSILPEDQAEYQGFADNRDAASKQTALLERDTVLFRWFACTYLLKDGSKINDVARAMYKAVRCSLVHGLTFGGTFRNGYGNYEIITGSANPDSQSRRWWNVWQDKSNAYVFYLKEFLDVFNPLVKDLFDDTNTDPNIRRFQTDATTFLAGKHPLVMLKAIPQK